MLTIEIPHSDLFWKTSKQLLEIAKISQNVPTLKLNDEFAETDLQESEAQFFYGKFEFYLAMLMMPTK